MSITRITMAEYLSDPCSAPSLSSSIAHTLIARSPLHAACDHPKLRGDAQSIITRRKSKAADVGTVAHDLLLGGEGKLCVIDPADYRSKPTKKCPEGTIPKGWTNDSIREAAETARENGLTPLLPWDMAAAQAMAEEARRFVLEESVVPGLFDDGEGELTCIVEHAGIWMRCRPDWMSDRYVLHYKTTQASAEPGAFSRGIMKSLGYDFSMEFYRACIALHDAAEGRVHERRHLMLVQEQDAPYACSLIDLSAAKSAVVAPKVEQAIELWRTCCESGKWPGYGGDVFSVEPQLWELEDVEVSYG